MFILCCRSGWNCSAQASVTDCEQKNSFNISCFSHLQVIDFDDGSGSVLRIQPLRTPRDEAIYECVASNTVGELSATTRLTVLRGRCCFLRNRNANSCSFNFVSSTNQPGKLDFLCFYVSAVLLLFPFNTYS